ncbi:MAG: TIGR00159 family protein [Bacteroidetes bacterium QS_9_68_14]|nr:MAG: TIGR00159 family protein [Bacteroidetes bacterium QS_9_68_14]
MPLLDILSIGIVDAVEITLVAYLLYRLYQLMRGTIAVQIFFGIVALVLVQMLVIAADMTMLGAIFSKVGEVFVLAVIILFQPEIRRLLLMIGQNPLVRRLVSSPAQEELIDEVVEAVKDMSEQKIGALIAFQRSTGLRSYVETGADIGAQVTSDLLVTIFYAQNPLHDGAAIIQNRRLEAARCILPVSTSMNLSPQMGLRHRAAVGLTEQTDAFVVIVSEETGEISVSEKGDLDSGFSPHDFRERLRQALSPQTRSAGTSGASASGPGSSAPAERPTEEVPA